MNALDIYEQTRGITDAESRRRYLDEACRGDASLRSRVEAMLLISEVPEAFLDPPMMDRPPRQTDVAAPSDASSETVVHDPLLGTVIGDVTLERLVGQGGMGRIYAGTQASTGGTVAVKLLLPHVVSENMLKRFEQEVRLLARLRHPGIAQVYTAGTATCAGVRLPFFLMEFIADALPITDYAEEHALDTRQRLELFRKICGAVAYGHAQGVIHRDLKPANILVDRFGQPKVIDFGVAKCTAADLAMTTLTCQGGVVGTLTYMSPEQAAGDQDAITERSDVYALGVILYELLAGRMPFDFAQALPIRVIQTITTADPRPLSSVSRAFRGDLDAITSKCLEKNHRHRYATATELDAEIGRHLAGEPILARRSCTLGSFARALAKRKAAAAAVVATAAILLAVVGDRPGRDAWPISWISAALRPTAPAHEPALQAPPAGQIPPAGAPAAPPPPAVVPFVADEAVRHQQEWSRHLGIEVETANSIGQTLVLIPPGRFAERGRELAVATPFLIGKTEVTQGEWREVMGAEPWKGRNFTIEGADVAATFVSWDDAVAFCGRLTARERREGRINAAQAYRLPTEAEWELACRAGAATDYCFGNAKSLLGDFAWYGAGRPADDPIPGGNTADEPYAHAVGRKQPNAWGLHDMHGNVWEWCTEFFTPATGGNRVVRGGAWMEPPMHCGSATRHGLDASQYNFFLGFRAALDSAIPSPARTEPGL